jgi:hypothetical protein
MADTTDKNKTPGNRTRREKQEVLVVGKKCGGRRAVRGEEKKIAGVAIGDEVFFPTSPGVKARLGPRGRKREKADKSATPWRTWRAVHLPRRYLGASPRAAMRLLSSGRYIAGAGWQGQKNRN